MAYPMAFLISPEEAKKEKLRIAKSEDTVNNSVATEHLRYIKVVTNLLLPEVARLMTCVPVAKSSGFDYNLSNGLKVSWQNRGKYSIAIISGSSNMQTLGEEYFKTLDDIAGRNVRLMDSNEYFYYNYDTSYTNPSDIYKKLKQENAKNIYTTADGEVIAEVEGQNIRYHKENNRSNFMLEVEQKVTILNIGMTGETQGTNVTFGSLTNLKIQTNIKKDELKTLLYKANYLYYEGNSQTPLKNSEATLNWVMKDGFYVAEFSGANNKAITKEAEIIFRKMNIAAGRDLRLINDQSTMIYTYNTNYTDKGTLLNTLIEHGAEELSEADGEISCKLFGMEMIYYKKDSSGAYTLDITQVSDKSECEDVINDLNEEYGLNIQEMTYNKIKERLEEENLRLESETVLDDNSIVLTIEV